MPTVSGRVIFDRDRSVTFSSGDSGLAGVPVVLQNINSTNRLTVLTDSGGFYSFFNVPGGNYRIAEAFGTAGGVPTPANFAAASPGAVPVGKNPPISFAQNPPAGSTDLDSLTPDTIFVTVSNHNLENENFFDGPVIYTPAEHILDECAEISGENLIESADDGTFGFFDAGTRANTGAPTEPYPGVTPDFTYVLPDPAVFAPLGGEYTVQNIMNNSMSAQIGAWWRIADHTRGNETGRMMIVNGFNPGAVFFRETLEVKPNTSYLFTAWILNLFRVHGFPDPELGVRVLDENGHQILNRALGALIPVNTGAPEWKQIGSVINSGENSKLTVEFLSEGPEVIGNDYAIDDVAFNEISIPVFTPHKSVMPDRVNVGESVKFTVTLTNTCESELTDLFFLDEVPDGLEFIPGSVTVNGTPFPSFNTNHGFDLPNLAGGHTVTVTFEARAKFVPNRNPAVNTAHIRYFYTPVQGGIPAEFNVESNEAEVLIEGENRREADLEVTKTAEPKQVSPGETLTYTVTVKNNGPDTAENVFLFDEIPPELAEVRFSLDGGAVWHIFDNPLFLGDIPKEECRKILIRGKVLFCACGLISNTAVVCSDTFDPDKNNNTATVSTFVKAVRCGADLCIKKTACPDSVCRRQKLSFTLTVKNRGPLTAENVVIKDDVDGIPEDAKFSVDAGHTFHAWHGLFEAGSLAAGEKLVIIICGTVDSCVKDKIINTASVSSSTADPDESNNVSTVKVKVRDCPCCH